MMKKKIKKSIEKFISKKGYFLLRKYELDFLDNKYTALIGDMEQVFLETVFADVSTASKEKELLAQLYGTSIPEAYYIIHYLRNSLKLAGEVCEFGVANGTASALLAFEIKKTKKNLFLFDSFEGLSNPGPKDKLINDIFKLGSMKKYKGAMAYKKEEVIERLKRISFPKNKTKIVEGYIEDVISQKAKLPKKVCFAYVDFDLYDPIRLSLDYLDCALSPKGYIVVDDYDYFSSGAKAAVDEFMLSHKKSYEIYFPKKFAGHFCILRKK